MREQSIINYTEQVAGEIATKFAGSPLDELRTWISIAHQREAMVSELYDLSDAAERFDFDPSNGPGRTARAVVASIWAHEESHTRYLGSLRSLSEGLPQLAEIQGELEGWVTGNAVNGSMLARLLIAIGASLGKVPEFATELGRMNLFGVLRFHAELETTARLGYERMLQLVAQLGNDPGLKRDFGYTLEFDLARILCEENFHEAVFAEMSSWVDQDGTGFRSLPARECAQALHRLCQHNLSTSAVRRLALSEDPRLEAFLPHDSAHEERWVSDGGLGGIFAEWDLPVPLASSTS